MTLNPEELKLLGEAILEADKDRFGLKTDGQGNVVIAPESGFMAEVMNLKLKYIAWADASHKTRENLLTRKNCAALEAAGVKHSFEEWNAKEKAELDKDMRRAPEELRREYVQSYLDLINGYKQLELCGIQMVASDPRKKDSTEKTKVTRQIDALNGSYDILNDLVVKLENESDPKKFSQKLTALSQTYFHKADGPSSVARNAFVMSLEPMLLDKVEVGMDSHRSEEEKDIALSDAHALLKIVALALKDGLPLTKKTPVTLQDIRLVKLKVARAIDGEKDKLLSILQVELEESDAIDKDVAATIKANSSADKKTLLRWGLGHFINDAKDPGQPDLDELLGSENTLVIATVLDPKEMNVLLQKLSANEMRDPPDYLYMPSYTDNGKIVPEKAVSVTEYLTSHPKKDQTPALQKSTGRH